MTLLFSVFSFVLAGGILPAVVLRRKGILWINCRQYDGLISHAFSLLLCYGIRLHIIYRKTYGAWVHIVPLDEHSYTRKTCVSINRGKMLSCSRSFMRRGIYYDETKKASTTS